MKPLMILRGSAFAVALSLTSHATARSGFEDVLPADCMVFVGVDDLEELKAGFLQTAWGRFLADPELTSIKDWVEKSISEAGSAAEQESGANPFELFEMISGSAAFFVLDLLDPEVSTPKGGIPPLAVGIMVGVGDRGEDFLALIETLLEGSIESGKSIREHEDEQGVEITVIRDTEQDDRGNGELRYALAEGVFVALAESEELVERGYFAALLNGLAGESEDMLSGAAGFAGSLAGEAQDGIRLFVDLERLIGRSLEFARSEESWSEQAETAVEALSPTDLRRLSANLTLSEDGSRIDMALDWSGEGHILRFLKALFGSGSLETPAMIPGDLLTANLVHIDLLAALEAGLAAAREIVPEETQGVEAMIDMLFAQEGFNVKEDLLGNLAGEVGFFTARIEDDLDALPGTDEDPQNFAVLIRLRDGGKFETALDALIRSQGMHAVRKQEEFQGQAYYSMPLPIIGGKLRYAVLDDLLIFSLSAELIQDVLRRRGESDLPTLADNEQFRDSLEALVRGEITSAGYNDAKASVQTIIEGLTMVLESEDFLGLEVNADPESLDFELPGPELAEKYFEGASVSVITLDENGIRITSSGP